MSEISGQATIAQQTGYADAVVLLEDIERLSSDGSKGLRVTDLKDGTYAVERTRVLNQEVGWVYLHQVQVSIEQLEKQIAFNARDLLIFKEQNDEARMAHHAAEIDNANALIALISEALEQ